MTHTDVLRELRVLPTRMGRRPSNAVVKESGLGAINAYRSSHDHTPLASLPRAHPGMGYDVCLVGACLSDMPDYIDRAKDLAEDDPNVHILELRFERGQLPELIAGDGEMPRLAYADAHDHALAV